MTDNVPFYEYNVELFLKFLIKYSNFPNETITWFLAYYQVDTCFTDKIYTWFHLLPLLDFICMAYTTKTASGFVEKFYISVLAQWIFCCFWLESPHWWPPFRPRKWVLVGSVDSLMYYSCLIMSNILLLIFHLFFQGSNSTGIYPNVTYSVNSYVCEATPCTCTLGCPSLISVDFFARKFYSYLKDLIIKSY